MTVGAALDVATVGVADVPAVLVEPALDAATVGEVVVEVDFDDVEDDFDDVEEEVAALEVPAFEVVAAACFAVVAAALAVVPTWAARPANRPVPVSAPASDQRVRCLIRRSPASRSLRLLAFRLLGLAAWLFMATIVDHGPKYWLGSR